MAARWLTIALGAGVVALPAIAAGLVLSRSSSSSPGDASPELRPGDDAQEDVEAAPAGVQMVRNRARLGGSVDERLDAFLDWWDSFGPFLVTVGLNGGLRTDAALQEQLWREGKTHARYLPDTPHGRGGAVDLWVYKLGTLVPTFDTSDPDTLHRYGVIGMLGKAHGLVWGGDWTSLRDLPHLEVPDWRDLPFPPRFA